MAKIDAPTPWAWELEEGMLCKWAAACKETLIDQPKPSPDAKPRCVRLIRNTDLRDLLEELRLTKAALTVANSRLNRYYRARGTSTHAD